MPDEPLDPITIRGTGWMLAGKCADPDADPDDWHPPTGTLHEGETGATRAAQLCMGCPVEARCLDYAMTAGAEGRGGELHGVWGGTTPAQRRAARHAAHRGAAA